MKKIKKVFFLCWVATFVFGFRSESNSQNVAAYTDYKGNLQVFDGGMYKQLEYLPVKDYKYGAAGVAYIDNKNDFKIYSNGATISMVNAADFQYDVTDYLIAFKVGNVLYAFDRGQKKTLCYYNSIMAVNDSLLAYFDDSKILSMLITMARLSTWKIPTSINLNRSRPVLTLLHG